MRVPGASFNFDTTTRFCPETEVVMLWRMDPFFVRKEGVSMCPCNFVVVIYVQWVWLVFGSVRKDRSDAVGLQGNPRGAAFASCAVHAVLSTQGNLRCELKRQVSVYPVTLCAKTYTSTRNLCSRFFFFGKRRGN